MKYLYLLTLTLLILTFTLTTINIKSYQDSWEEVGEEPPETFSITGFTEDLDITKLEVQHVIVGSDIEIYFKIWVKVEIDKPESGNKKWYIHMDVDCDSLNTESEDTFNGDYDIVITLWYNGTHEVSGGEYVSGGYQYNYWEVKVKKSDIEGLGNMFLISLETGFETISYRECDKAPDDNNGDRCGDFWIYYINPPQLPIGGQWGLDITDPDDTISGEEYLDIIRFREDYDSNNLYFQIQVDDNIPWYGGYDKAIYIIYIDVDPDQQDGDPYHCNADYKLVMRVGYAVRLYYHIGGGSYEAYKRELWPHAPGLGDTLTIISPKSHYTHKQLGSTIKVMCETWRDDDGPKDRVGEECEPAPVPESSILSLIAVCIVLLRILFIKK